jgi:dienelactone hydrolase
MQDPRGVIAQWVRRAATSALGTYGAYIAYGLVHPALRHPYAGPESSQRLPGDDLVAAADSSKTFAIDIGVPPAAVWPYLVQMGYGRAGWYGWYPMENGGRGSSHAILEQWQELAVGDTIPDGPRADDGLGTWRVVELDPPSTMVLFSRRVATTGREIAAGELVDEPTIECSWAFVLRPNAGGSRLLVRVRVRFLAMDDGVAGRMLRRFFDLGDTVMEWTMIDGIKARAERIAVMPPMDASSREVRIPSASGTIFGSLTVPEKPRALVLLAHDGGTRHRLRNLRVARDLQVRGFATLLLDLHASGQIDARGQLEYDIDAMAERIIAATDWARTTVPVLGLPVGYIAAGMGAAAAVVAAARRPMVDAIVAFSGRPDRIEYPLPGIPAPVLLVVGADDAELVAINRAALPVLRTGSRLVTVPGAAHLFEEPGALDHVSYLACEWLIQHLASNGGSAGEAVPEGRFAD